MTSGSTLTLLLMDSSSLTRGQWENSLRPCTNNVLIQIKKEVLAIFVSDSQRLGNLYLGAYEHFKMILTSSSLYSIDRMLVITMVVHNYRQ